MAKILIAELPPTIKRPRGFGSPRGFFGLSRSQGDPASRASLLCFASPMGHLSSWSGLPGELSQLVETVHKTSRRSIDLVFQFQIATRLTFHPSRQCEQRRQHLTI